MKVNELLYQLDAFPYPVTTAEVVDELGDPEMQLPNGTDRLSAVFDRVDITTVHSAEDAKLLMLSALNNKAVGRRYYSDRDPPSLGEDRPERVSL